MDLAHGVLVNHLTGVFQLCLLYHTVMASSSFLVIVALLVVLNFFAALPPDLFC
jgi:hypothetical protein